MMPLLVRTAARTAVRLRERMRPAVRRHTNLVEAPILLVGLPQQHDTGRLIQPIDSALGAIKFKFINI